MYPLSNIQKSVLYYMGSVESIGGICAVWFLIDNDVIVAGL